MLLDIPLVIIFINYELSIINYSSHGGLAQLARAPALQAGGQRFESVILHLSVGILVFRVSAVCAAVRVSGYPLESFFDILTQARL